jgi:putative ABC transport system ATP-binding protein
MDIDDDTRQPIVSLSGVSRVFREGERTVQALDGVDFALAAGEFACITGPSGSGKSTMLAVVGGVDRDFSGRAEVCGTDLGGASDAELSRFRNRNVGFVFQEFHLLPHLTVLDNLIVPLVLRGVSRSRAVDRGRGLAEQMGILPLLGAKARVLSTGEKQRVALGRALAGGPRLVLADEPTASLDRANAEEVLELLERAVRETGTSLLAVTHDPRLAEKAGRRYRMSGGRLESA